MRKKNKQHLFEWLVEADFTKEVSLASLGDHPFRLDEEEEDIELSTESLMKILKM